MEIQTYRTLLGCRKQTPLGSLLNAFASIVDKANFGYFFTIDDREGITKVLQWSLLLAENHNRRQLGGIIPQGFDSNSGENDDENRDVCQDIKVGAENNPHLCDCPQ